jgi:hypothetical protein
MSETNSLAVGADVGECRIAENREDLLRLAVPQTLPVICIAIGIAALVPYVVMILPRVNQRGLLEAFFNGRKLEVVLLCVGLAALVLGLSRLGVSFFIDGSAHTITKRHVIVLWRKGAAEFESVLVSVGHQGPNEILVLSLVPRKGDQIVLGMTPSDDRGLPLVATAARVSELLALPIVRQGTPVQGT